MAETKEVKKLDISKFFTRKNEEEGVWFSPTVYGEKFGLKFKVLGKDAIALSVAIDEYNRKNAEIQKIKDSEERAKAYRNLVAESCAKRITGMMPDDGFEISVDGKPFEYDKETAKNIFFECPEVADEIMSFSLNTGNFMTGKKN